MFAVRESNSDAADDAALPAFPHALRPFNLIPADELQGIIHRLDVDLDSQTYTLNRQERPRAEWQPQIDCLHTLYPHGVHGHISKPHRVEASGRKLNKLDRRRQRIPERATHFVFAYQLVQWFTDNFT
eukprot:COSAG04_NODE_9965_length_816_cov_1.125523_2_plen_127_part_01